MMADAPLLRSEGFYFYAMCMTVPYCSTLNHPFSAGIVPWWIYMYMYYAESTFNSNTILSTTRNSPLFSQKRSALDRNPL